MDDTIEDHITQSLNNLLENDLKKFKTKLCEECEIKFPRRKVLKFDSTGLRDCMISCYGETRAAEKTIQILEAINQKDIAETLKENIQREIYKKINLNLNKMDDTIEDHITQSLNNLLENDLKKFKTKLCEECEIKFPRRKVLKFDSTVLTDCMISCYGETRAAEKTIQILEAINQKDIAETLKENIQREIYKKINLNLNKMDDTIEDHITQSLNNLLENDLKKFKTKLCEECEIKFPRRKVLKFDSTVLTDCMISCYGETRAAEKTIQILEAINQKDIAETLKENIQREAALPGTMRVTVSTSETSLETITGIETGTVSTPGTGIDTGTVFTPETDIETGTVSTPETGIETGTVSMPETGIETGTVSTPETGRH
ncbi:uncharacterized protein LOC131722719 [Acipenser ruthenus]|uniref:uncharacterized protein LOC131722719 n=1 Tax=Acipenser ruthenus TaxID=7906 RepID=UPI0027421788|nr:uncharacterized protein LOC131722719 [Acipenser ruthenus]